MQSYSLQESKLLDPSHNHPSPPTVFAISSNFNLLLSASVSPPTIHLTNLLLNTPPILLRPQCSPSAAVTAEFHPERPNIFLLAFADGTCATYDAARIFRDNGRGGRRSESTVSGTSAETMFIKNIHATSNLVTSAAPECATEPCGYDYGTGIAGIGNKAVGITAAAFVPGYKSRFVTVGADGKCCVIDLPKHGNRDACVVNSWRVQGPATSLSITRFRYDTGIFGHDDAQGRKRSVPVPKYKALIAIGCQDGRVLLFDLRGNKLGDECFHPNSDRVIDVEWMSGDDVKMKGSTSNYKILPTPVPRENAGVGSVLARGRLETEEVVSILDGTDEGIHAHVPESSVDERYTKDDQKYHLPTNLHHMDLFSPIKPLPDLEATENELSEKLAGDSEDSQDTVKAISNKSKPQFANSPSIDPRIGKASGMSRRLTSVRDQHPPMPSRPAPRKGVYSNSRAGSSNSDAAKTAVVKGHANDRTKRDVAPRPTRGLAIFAPYMKPNVIAIPASATDLKPEGSVNKPTAQDTAPETLDDDLWRDIAPDPPEPSRRTRPRRVSTKMSGSYNKFGPFPQASSRPSEASNDTVIDWSAASSRPPNPIIFHNLPELPAKGSKNPEKNHISVSNSSMTDDPLVQWSSFRKGSIFNIHTDVPAPAIHLPSLHSPTEPLNASLTSPLAETAHNPRRNPESSGSRLKPDPLYPPAIARCAFCSAQDPQLTPHLRTVLQGDLRALGEDVARQFAAQKRWFEVKWDESQEVARRLEAENRALRIKLAWERKPRGR